MDHGKPSLTSILNKEGKDLLQSSTRDISERIEALEKERQLNKLKLSFIRWLLMNLELRLQRFRNGVMSRLYIVYRQYGYEG